MLLALHVLYRLPAFACDAEIQARYTLQSTLETSDLENPPGDIAAQTPPLKGFPSVHWPIGCVPRGNFLPVTATELYFYVLKLKKKKKRSLRLYVSKNMTPGAEESKIDEG